MEGGTIVEIPQGKLRGTKDETVFGEEFYRFQRIPYAKPPVGKLRFKAPEAAEGWEGVRDATEEGATCPSVDWERTRYLPGSDEDSLFLNVYCKHKPDGASRYPVMVSFHGGGFEFDSGNRSNNGPDYFMFHDVVVVTFNYRLGALGFLSLQTEECPGNYGLKDQRLALVWVKNNIAHFGGDPDNVTLFGISAGAASVQYHTFLSPASERLFHRAIAQSGSSINRWGLSRRPRVNAFLLGKRLGCDTEDDQVLLEFLRSVPAEDILLKSQGISKEVEGVSYGEDFLSFSFTPTTEPDHDGAFVTKHPWLLLRDGDYFDVPYITGITNKEMILGMAGNNHPISFASNEDFQGFIPKDVQLEKGSPEALHVAERIREFYFKNGIDIDNYIDMLSDTFFNYGVYKTVKSRTTNKNIKSPTYLYMFTYEGDQPFLKDLLGLTDFKGVSHGEDTNFTYKTDFLKMESMKSGSRDYRMMRNLISLWVNFATEGVPSLHQLSWKETNASDLDYLDIGEKLEMKKGFIKDRMEFWDDIYSSYYNRIF